MTEMPVVVDLLFFLFPVMLALVTISTAFKTIWCKKVNCKHRRYCDTPSFKSLFIIASVFLIACQVSWWGVQYVCVDVEEFPLSIFGKITWVFYTGIVNLIFILILKNCEFQSILMGKKNNGSR